MFLNSSLEYLNVSIINGGLLKVSAGKSEDFKPWIKYYPKPTQPT